VAARGIHPARLDLTWEERATLERWTRRGRPITTTLEQVPTDATHWSTGGWPAPSA
jgi:hypothetical protein